MAQNPAQRRALALLATAPLAFAAASAVPAAAATRAALVSNPASLVNPFIGTTQPGRRLPRRRRPLRHGPVSPDTPSRPDGGGYEYNDSSITGFSLTHLSGPGCSGEGDVPILPTVGSVNTGATDSFSHSNESASPGYYSVQTSNGVTTQLTVTPRSGMASFTFPSTTQANLIFKLNGSANSDSNTQFNVVSSTKVSGQVTSGGFCGATASLHGLLRHGLQTRRSRPTAARRSRPRSGHDAPERRRTRSKLHGRLCSKRARRPTMSNAVTPNVLGQRRIRHLQHDLEPDLGLRAKVGVSFRLDRQRDRRTDDGEPERNFVVHAGRGRNRVEQPCSAGWG